MNDKIGFSVSKETALKIVASMYEGEPCRICGKPIQVNKSVWAGYSSDGKSRTAHKACWDKNLPKSEWAYPIDEEK